VRLRGRICLGRRGSDLPSLSVCCPLQLGGGLKKTGISVIPWEILILYSKNCIYARLCKQLFSLSSLSSHMLSHLFTYLLIANITVSLDLHIESSGDWKSRRKYQIHALRMQSRSIQKLTMESVTFRTSLLSHEQLPSLK
jgi:hypothetical protein